MTDSTEFKDWWKEARANGGHCEYWHAWWDSNGSKSADERIIPVNLSEKQLLATITPSALMKLPAHYYANYNDDTWHKLAQKTDLTIVDKKFSVEGSRVDATVRVNIYKSMFIENDAMADAVDMLLTRWAKFAQDYPGAGASLLVRSEDKVPVICSRAYHGCNEGELLVAEAAFDTLMQDLKTNPDFVAWVANMVSGRGSRPKTFQISEEIWFGHDNPTMQRVRYEVSGGKRGKAPNFGTTPGCASS